MDIYLSFAYPISVAYRKKLQTFSNTILAQGITENRPPKIGFPGMKRKTFDKIIVLRLTFSAHH